VVFGVGCGDEVCIELGGWTIGSVCLGIVGIWGSGSVGVVVVLIGSVGGVSSTIVGVVWALCGRGVLSGCVGGDVVVVSGGYDVVGLVRSGMVVEGWVGWSSREWLGVKVTCVWVLGVVMVVGMAAVSWWV
jgi:hypothetical protein